MKELLTKQNIAMAGASALAVMLAMSLTATKGKIWQGAASVVAAGVALHLARKIA